MTPLEKLRALAASKRNSEQPIQEVIQNENVSSNSAQGTESKQELPEDKVEQGSEVHSDEDLVLVSRDLQEGTGVSSDSNSNNAEPDPGSSSRLAEDHPLKMQLAELEQALTEKLPEFRTILRDIHAKLRADPDCVTAMSEDEIGSIVQGLIHHANVDVIAPRAMKSAKKASKIPVSASDL